MFRSILIALSIIASLEDLSLAILVGDHDHADNRTSPLQNKNLSELESANITFQYEANEFLLNNKRRINEPVANSSIKWKIGPDESKNDERDERVIPASQASTSARNGRMMDLDALVGDFSASHKTKLQSMTGNRQSRFLSNSNLEVGGKKLQIQGFIPIVGMKDDSFEDQSHGQESSGEREQSYAKQTHPFPQNTNDLPYAQSSVGHATFGVQRYLQTDQGSYPSDNQQTTSKSSVSPFVESIKAPLKRLTSFTGVSGQGSSSSLSNQQKNSDCLCVPFYMCKNGYISESSVTKSQIQKLITQQQQQLQTPFRSEEQSGQTQASLGPQQSPINQPQYADSFVPVDERSLDKELMSAAAASAVEAFAQEPSTNQTESPLNQISKSEPLEEHSNMTVAPQALDYSQEILGRMLGLKGVSNQRQSSNQQMNSQSNSCGLLRTCCNIPPSILSSLNQPDIITLESLNQVGQSNNFQQSQSAYIQAPRAKAQPQGSFQSGMISPLARFQSLSPNTYQVTSKPLAYASSQENNYIRSPSTNTISQTQQDLANSLAHRSNQFQSLTSQYSQLPSNLNPSMNRYPSQSQQMLSSASQFYPSQSKALTRSQPLNMMVRGQANNFNPGSRKILDGRCGLRQSAGINGRVQNLQYQETSADFGEYPAQAAILKRLSGSDSLFVCSGTLISQYWIATAAHCIKKHGQAELKVRLGEWDVHRDDEFYPFLEKEVRDVVIHPEFVAGNLVNDIALLRLDSPVDPSLPHINPACLPIIDELFTHQRCWVTGWGKDSFGQKGSFQSVLQEVELPVIGHTECESALRHTRLGPHYRLHSGFMCAGGEGGRDACEGDGGSGLYCLHDGVIKVVGIVSWGIGCGQAGVPGVYVNLAHYRPWIENIISIDEDIYSPHSNMIGGNMISERSNTNKTEETNRATTSEAPSEVSKTTE